MGLLDKVIAVAGVAVLGTFVKSAIGEAMETARRKNTPLSFDDGLTEDEFVNLAHEAARRTSRCERVLTTGMVATIDIRSNTGLSTWSAKVDFNDYGHLTGRYWLTSDNTQSIVPEHFAKLMQAEILRCVSSPPRSPG